MTDDKKRRSVPIKRLFIGTIIFFAGFAAFGGVNTFFAYTDQLTFCTSCHSMQENLREYKQSIHYKNSAGVRAVCSDCHVPHAFLPKVWAKIMAAKDVWGEFTGVINTKEKLEKHRWELANVVWAKMKASNSRACRKCHAFTSMDLKNQSHRAAKQHERAEKKGETCIDCHQGIAHDEPDIPEDVD